MTAKVAKVENYSAEVSKELVERYVAGETVEALASAFGKSVKSVVAKLVREKVYVSKEKAKVARVTKADLVAKVAEALGVSKEVLASLEKGTHEALEALESAVHLLSREAEYFREVPEAE